MSIAEYLHEGEIALGSSMPRLASKKAFLLVPAFDDQLEPSCSLALKREAQAASLASHALGRKAHAKQKTNGS